MRKEGLGLKLRGLGMKEEGGGLARAVMRAQREAGTVVTADGRAAGDP